jgi:hypothetical protein
MNKHTPAPWVIAHGRCIYGSGDLVKPFVASVEDDHNDSETAANARLIAAAPDLLEALCEMLGAAEIDCMDDKSNVWRGLMINARAAIAKATGEAA